MKVICFPSPTRLCFLFAPSKAKDNAKANHQLALVKKQVEKEFIHVDTFKELFPFAKAIVATVSANAGIQPIIVQDVDIESQEIYRFDLPKRRPKEDTES